MKKRLFITIICLILAAVMCFGCAEGGNTETGTESETGTVITDTQTEENIQTEGTDTEAVTEPETDVQTTDTEEAEQSAEATESETETTVTPETTVPEETTAETTQEVTTAPETTAAEETTKAPVTTAPVTEKPEETTAPATTAPETQPEETTPAEEKKDVTLLIPEKSSAVSYDFARQLLEICSDGGENATVSTMKFYNFDIVFTKNYYKPASDKSHTCAFAFGKGVYKGKTVYLITIRGTKDGEWYSNMDFAPSRSNDTQYAENFLAAARDIYLHVKKDLESEQDPMIIVCGHSRGAAVSNLLGALLDSVYNRNNIYVYTFATPATVRGDAAKVKYENIFNFINPADVVTILPLQAHGYKRAGKDIILPGEANKEITEELLPEFVKLAPDIESYYKDKHSLTAAGLSDDGVTMFEIMNSIAGYIVSQNAQDIAKLESVKEESDLYPLISKLLGMTDFTKLYMLISEHMTVTYDDLIDSLNN